MKKHRLLAALTAAACSAGIITVAPEMTIRTFAAEVVYNDFEVNYDGWYGNADAVKLVAVEGEGFNESRGMTVSGRLTPDDGASSSKGFYLEGGVEYDYSVKVYSETDETFRISLLCIDEATGEETIKEIASEDVRAGKWTAIKTSYKAPENSYEFRLTITTDSTNDFSFDDVYITTDEKLPSNTAFAASSNLGLKDAFGKYFRVGNILNGGTIRNSTITASVLKDYNSIECENETKPDATLVQSQCSGTNIGVSLNSAAAIMDFCVKNGIGMRGHAFVWHSQTPSWFFKEGFSNSGAWVSESTMNARLESYIKNMFNAIETQYPSLNLYAYDVVNEAVSDDSNRTKNNGGARVPGDNNVTSGQSAWVQVYGDNGFVEKAFEIADKYAPEGCSLFYNDYNEYWDHKRDCIYNMCKSLYEKGYLDGIGMQSHINANYDGFSGVANYTTAMKKYASIGCEVQVTELDVTRENGTYSDQQQADKYKAVFQAAIDINEGNYPGKVTAVCIWGPNDANTWIKTENAPLLYDTNHQPKTAYNTLMSMVPQSEWVIGGYEGGEIPAPEPNEYGWYYQHGFEDGTNSWTDRGGNKISQSSDEHYTEWGSKSLYVTDRTSAWMGAAYTLNSRAFKAGKTYSFSAHVKQKSGENVKFMMKIEYTDATGETAYDEVANALAPNDTWTQLVNTEYTIPADASNVKIYIETEESLTNFYIDEAIGAVGGTGIAGEGQPVVKVVIPGDISFDGAVNSLDMILARKGIINGISDSDTKRAADVDRNGVYEAADLVLIQQFILGKIKEFPVAEKVIDTTAMENLFNGISLNSSYKKDGENNVLWTQRFGADPGFMVYKDRLYVYTTNDAPEYRSDGKIQVNTYNVQTINCFSSADLVNWTDHGAIPVAGRNNGVGAAKWASFSWAPDAAWKTINGKDKFFLYFADSAGGIGVLTADSPEGPWTDPIGKALINKSTPGFSDVEWLFDPAVLVDDDGSGYLYVGGGVPSGKAADPGTARAIKLGDDMISLSGSAVRMNPPYLFEDSSILKVGNTYYYSYCTNWSTGGNPYGFGNAEIAVMTSTNPLGPFEYKGIALKNPASYKLDGGGNNHHSIVEFKGKYYVLYHSRNLSRAMNIQALNTDGSIDLGGNYRSPHIDEATFSNGMFSATGTMKGVSQIEALNPYNKVQAETMSNQSQGIAVNGLGNTTVSAHKGNWIKASGADFSKGADTLTIRASSKNGGAIKVCTGSATGNVVTYAEVDAGGSMTEISVPVVNSVNGSKDIYFVFSGDIEFDWWQFS